MSKRDMHGEGNHEADRRYRKGVRKTVDETEETERAEKARSLSDEEKRAAREAETEGKRRSRH